MCRQLARRNHFSKVSRRAPLSAISLVLPHHFQARQLTDGPAEDLCVLSSSPPQISQSLPVALRCVRFHSCYTVASNPVSSRIARRRKHSPISALQNINVKWAARL